MPLSPQGAAAPGRFQILALDGGGVKALFTAHVLARLEEDLSINISDRFDLIAGTSAGGIIALALGAGIRPAEIVDHYEQLARSVFPSSRRRLPMNIARLWRPTYDGDRLRAVLGDVLGGRRLGDSSKRLVVPAHDVQRGQVHIFKTPHHPRLRRDWKIPMVDVALATSAAPTYFEAAKVDGQRLVDGGVWANNPSAVAVTEAHSMLDAALDDMRVLNIGTTNETPNHPRSLDRGGLLQWARPATEVLLTASTRGVQGMASHLVGNNNYVRFDAQVHAGLYALDDADPEELAGLASGISRELSPTFNERFADHHASPYQPAHRSEEQAS